MKESNIIKKNIKSMCNKRVFWCLLALAVILASCADCVRNFLFELSTGKREFHLGIVRHISDFIFEIVSYIIAPYDLLLLAIFCLIVFILLFRFFIKKGFFSPKKKAAEKICRIESVLSEYGDLNTVYQKIENAAPLGTLSRLNLRITDSFIISSSSFTFSDRNDVWDIRSIKSCRISGTENRRRLKMEYYDKDLTLKTSDDIDFSQFQMEFFLRSLMAFRPDIEINFYAE